MRVKPLCERHLAPLVQYLGHHPDTSMFLRSNLHRDGLGGPSGAHHATYVGAFDGEQIVGVIAHYWTGVLIPQAPVELIDALARLVVGMSGRPVTGVVGPAQQVAPVRKALGLSDAYARMDSAEYVYSNTLAGLEPPPLAQGDVLELRAVSEVEDEPVLSWYRAYEIETLGAREGADLESAVRARLRRNRKDGLAWIAHHEGEPVCVVGFNARLPDVVQVGGAYTPPEHRGSGYAAAASVKLLCQVRDEGVERASLFIQRDNLAAQRTYESVGFQRVGEVQLVLFT